jgi:hypothetical protein
MRGSFIEGDRDPSIGQAVSREPRLLRASLGKVAAMNRRGRSRVLGAVALVLLVAPGAAAGAGLDDPVNQWLPSSDDATWTYVWTDSVHARTPTREKYTFVKREQTAFRILWTTEEQGNPEGSVPSAGFMDFNRTQAGLINLNWNSVPPPPHFPVLCPSVSECSNSMASTYFMLIWGTRSPVLAEPLLQRTQWGSLGGVSNDVSSQNRYLGRERVVVPAYPQGVTAAKVQSDITQAGAIGDPYGSGVRTVWWVHGVGPVRIDFQHAGGEIGHAELESTNLTPKPAPSDVNYLPLNRGDRMRFRWRNSKHMRQFSRQQLDVVEVANNTARVDVKSLSGPIKLAGTYTFATRLTGITNLSGATRSASRAKFPGLGPSSQPRDRRRRLLTPLDFMSFGFNPVLTGYPAVGQTWRSRRGSRDHSVYGVTGTTKIVGVERVRTPLGRLRALVVRSTLTQKGFKYGSGRRTSYFAPGRGLVKLVFRHRDGSVSTIERLR